MYLSIIILPLLGSIVSGFFGRKIGVNGSQIVTNFCIIIATILGIVGFMEVGVNNNPVSVTLFKWLNSESFNINIGFQFDSLTVYKSYAVLVKIQLYWWTNKKKLLFQISRTPAPPPHSPPPLCPTDKIGENGMWRWTQKE